VSNPLVEFFRCPADLVSLSSLRKRHSELDPFRLDLGAHSYGSSTFDTSSSVNGASLCDGPQEPCPGEPDLRVPFDLSKIIDTLRLERYSIKTSGTTGALLSSEAARQAYYQLRPMLSDSVRKGLQRLFLRQGDKLPFPKWPVDTSVECILENLLIRSIRVRRVEKIPFIWFWPDGAPAAAIVTHDVETAAGVNSIPALIDIDVAFQIKASFQLVPEERYEVSKALLDLIRGKQCEVNVHGLNHNGNLFGNQKNFLRQAKAINRYMQEFKAEGFRSACMYRNVDWYDKLDIAYDMSVPNVAHMEPQRGGCCTVFPYFIGKILELPLTTIQDYSLFNILGDYSIELWKRQIELIEQKHGLISFIVHPDYIMAERALSIYKTLLAYLSNLRNEGRVWIALPGAVNRWWRERNAMKLVLESGRWRIVGPGHQRARLAFASTEGGAIRYTVTQGWEATADPAWDPEGSSVPT
jgi:hypothetical protein